MRIVLALLVLASLSGCRESIVGPAPVVPQEPGPAALRAIIVKGPRDVLPVGEAAELRAQPTNGVVAFRWSLLGPGTLVLPSDASVANPLNERVFAIRGGRTGQVTAGVYGYGANGARVAYGEKVFVVTNR